MSALAHLARRTCGCAASSGARVTHRQLPPATAALCGVFGGGARARGGVLGGGVLGGVRAKTTYLNVILLEDVEYVGKKGEEISVRRGYARNYLIPKQRALFGTPQNRKMFKTAPWREVKVASGKSEEVRQERRARRLLQKLGDPGIWIKRQQQSSFGGGAAFARGIDPQHVANALKIEHRLELDRPHHDVRFLRELDDFGEFDDAVEVFMRTDTAEGYAGEKRREKQSRADSRGEELDPVDLQPFTRASDKGAFVPLRVRVVQR